MELKELLKNEEPVNVTITLAELLEFVKIMSKNGASPISRKNPRNEF